MNAAEVAVALGKPRREGRHWRCLCPLHGGHSLIVGMAQAAGSFSSAGVDVTAVT